MTKPVFEKWASGVTVDMPQNQTNARRKWHGCFMVENDQKQITEYEISVDRKVTLTEIISILHEQLTKLPRHNMVDCGIRVW